jgi:hypothetical protein
VFLASNDRGATWEQRLFSGIGATANPYIAAVDKTDAEKVYVRTDEWESGAAFAARDVLLYSGDGGRTWNEVISKRAKLLGFALSPDGATVLVGYGDPVLPGGLTVDATELGLYKASTGDFLFERIFEASISCLQWTATGLYACVSQNHPALPRPGLGLGFAPNADFSAATASPFTSLLDVRNVRGPLACTVDRCAESWQMGVGPVAPVCRVLEASCDADPAANVLACRSGGTDGGGAAGTGGTGGGAGQGAGGARDGGGDTGAGGSNEGCGCSQASSDARRPLLALVLPGALVLLVVRLGGRRRRR